MAATEKLGEAEAIRKAAQEAVGVGTSAPKTKPKDLRAVAREAVGDPNAVPTKDRDAYQDQDVFAPGIAKVLANVEVEAAARFGPAGSRERKAAQFKLSQLRQENQAKAPARQASGPSAGQASSREEWEEFTREKLQAMTSQARTAVVFSEWYSGLSERGQEFVDSVSLELEYGPLMVDDTERPSPELTEEQQALNAWLDSDDDEDDDLAEYDDVDLEAESAYAEYDADIDATLEVSQ